MNWWVIGVARAGPFNHSEISPALPSKSYSREHADGCGKQVF